MEHLQAARPAGKSRWDRVIGHGIWNASGGTLFVGRMNHMARQKLRVPVPAGTA